MSSYYFFKKTQHGLQIFFYCFGKECWECMISRKTKFPFVAKFLYKIVR